MNKRILLFLLCVCVCVLLCACRKAQPGRPAPDELITGGQVVRTDPNAPKTIASTQIVSLDMHFYCEPPMDYEKSGVYEFTLEPNEAGTPVLSAGGIVKLSTEVDDTAAQQAQKIIEEYNLVRWNGIDEYTAGLAPECGPCYLRAEYESGETLYFCMDGNPTEGWMRAFYTLFAKTFAEHGHNDLMRAPEDCAVADIMLEYRKDGIYCRYGTLKEETENGEETKLLTRWVLDAVKNEEISFDEVPCPEELNARVEAFLLDVDLDPLNNGSLYFKSVQDMPDGAVCFSIEYESGQTFQGYVDDEETLAPYREMWESIASYLDSCFE